MKPIYKNIFIKFLLLVFVVGAKGLFAQQDIVLNDIIVGKAEVSASHSITLKKGFVAKAGSTFRAYIDPNANSTVTNPVITSTTTVTVTGTPTTGTNYVRSISFPATASRNEQITYYDGLGRPEQTINVKGSPTGQDIIQHIYYDNLGRESRKYLPYTAAGNGEYRTSAHNDVISYYQSTIAGKSNTDNKPYSETDFEASPLNRVLNITGVGQEWNSKAVEYNYLTNTSAVNSWDVNGTSLAYSANSLYVNQTADEEGNVTKEYKNLLGQVVLKESVNGAEILRTYYIYDDFGLLRTVVPPLATSPANTELCYFYTYDNRKRMISKKLPGAEIVYMVYDKRDRLVLVQDGNLRNDGDATKETFRFTKYDVINRPIMTGTITILSTLENIRTQFMSHDIYYETYNGNSSTYGYSLNSSYPDNFDITANNVETVTWYDNYDFIEDLTLTSTLNFYTTNLPTGFTTTESSKVKGLATGSLVKAFEPDGSGYTMTKTEMYSANYYDDYGNVIQSIAQNHLNGLDVLSSRYEPVTHQLKETQQQHLKNGTALVAIKESYKYDHAGRLLETRHKANNQDEIVLTSMRYNELGELIQKYLHSKDAQSFVQKIDYTYNIRGWLTKINDPALSENDVFGMQLYYNNLGNLDNSTAPKEMYNGNIAAMRWNTAGDIERGYGFIYDGLNRLTAANYAEGSTLASNKGLFSENITQYDKNGNIIKLNRRFNNASTYADQLTYSYITGTNKLKKVTDPAGDMTGIEDYVVRSTADYGYDKNGNMTFDPGKDARVTYNPLNLPESVSDNSNSVKIFYHYDAAGRKLAKTNESSSSSVDNTTDYVGNIIYVNNEIAYIMTSEGRMVPVADGDNTRWHYEYNIQDHLGNTRVTFGGSLLAGKVDLVQQSHYYPFGLVFKETNYQNSITDYTKNKYLYNGKELQDDQLAGRSLNWYDYGKRFYDAAIGRFHTLDPKAEMYYFQNPFAYAANNPILFIDKNGENPYLHFDGVTGIMFIFDDGNTPDDKSDDIFVDVVEAHNEVASSSNGKWEDGEYSMLDTDTPHTHGEENDSKGVKKDSKNGAYGKGGIFRAKNFTQKDGKERTGMGVHAGRANKDFKDRKTMGCIRLKSDDDFDKIKKAITKYGSLTKIIVTGNTTKTTDDTTIAENKEKNTEENNKEDDKKK